MSTKTDALNDLNVLSRAIYGVDFGQPLPARRRAAPAPSPVARIRVGSTVKITHKGEVTRGVVTKVNPKTYSIAATEARRGKPAGALWKASHGLVTLDTSPQATTEVPYNEQRALLAMPALRVGTRVRFGRPGGTQYTGVIAKVNAKTYNIRADQPFGSGWRCSYDVRCSRALVTAV